ncbi:penicillin acylase family protein [Streptomyces sp. HK10]|uniref:penicillin acylase family protein n=1 Tax=Streptomyces sp. HK10 TaxID=3373255 RepID=UPI003749D4DB
MSARRTVGRLGAAARLTGVRALAAAAAGLDSAVGGRSTAALPAGAEIVALAAMHRFRARVDAARRRVPGLRLDRHGIPHVFGTGVDVWRGLGFATAAARLFQMDLVRRRAAGRSSELLGPDLAEQDARQRPLGFACYAERIVAALSADQRQMLDAYAEGVNQLLRAAVPWEYAVLGRAPEPWRPADSVLVVQDLFQQLTDPAVDSLEAAFADAPVPHGRGTGLTGEPLTDAVAADRLRAALRGARGGGAPVPPEPAVGSNGWVLAADRTAVGGPLLANDIHLPLGSPGPLFFVRLTVDARPAHGFALPGVPALVAGANADVSWGLTRLCGRTARRLPAAAAPLLCDRTEELAGTNRTVRVRLAVAGPVLPDGSVLRWTALDPEAVDFGLARLVTARSVPEACEIARTSGAPPTSLLVADAAGRTGWAPAGRLLAADSEKLVPAADVPQVLDPDSGLLVAANQDLGVLLPDGSPVTVNAYPDARARRITALLDSRRDWRPAGLFGVQYDADAAFFRPWAELFARHAHSRPRARAALLAWDGTAGTGARGLHLLALAHDLARQEILAPLSASSSGTPGLTPPSLSGLDDELAELVREEDPSLLPAGHTSWPAFLSWCVEAADRYLTQILGPNAADLPWGRVNRARLRHPLAGRLPRLARLIEPPGTPLAGCTQSVSVAAGGFGAAMRMVADPAAGTLWANWPGGQTADPLDPGHRALLADWVGGRARRLPLPAEPSTVTEPDRTGAP